MNGKITKLLSAILCFSIALFCIYRLALKILYRIKIRRWFPSGFPDDGPTVVVITPTAI